MTKTIIDCYVLCERLNIKYLPYQWYQIINIIFDDGKELKVGVAIWANKYRDGELKIPATTHIAHNVSNITMHDHRTGNYLCELTGYDIGCDSSSLIGMKIDDKISVWENGHNNKKGVTLLTFSGDYVALYCEVKKPSFFPNDYFISYDFLTIGGI